MEIMQSELSTSLPGETRSWFDVGRRSLVLLLLLSGSLNIALSVALHRARAVNDVAARASGTVDFHGPDLGKTLALLPAKDLAGSPVAVNLNSSTPLVVLYVYSPTCHWCARNLENIKQLHRTLQSRGTARVIGVSFGEQGLQEYISKSNLEFPTYNVSLSDLQEYHLRSTPHTLVIQSGKIVKDWSGAYAGDLQREIETFFDVQLPGLTDQ